MKQSFIAAVEEFHSYFQKDKKEQFVGTFEKLAQVRALQKINGINLSPELEYFYSRYEPDFVFGYLTISFTSYSRLSSRQKGYEDSLNSGWTIFADMDDDPIVGNNNIRGTEILAAIEGISYYTIAPSLEKFVILCQILLETEIDNKAHEPDSEKDFEAYLEHHNKVVRSDFLSRANKLINPEHLSNLEHFFYS